MGSTGGDGNGRFADREHSMRAELGDIREAREFAAKAAADFGCDPVACQDVKVAMSEAVTNAIQHGSSETSDPIKIAVAAEGPALVFDVVDTGRFKAREGDGDPLGVSGRGLAIIRMLMDEMLVRPGARGTVTRFVKRCA